MYLDLILIDHEASIHKREQSKRKCNHELDIGPDSVGTYS